MTPQPTSSLLKSAVLVLIASLTISPGCCSDDVCWHRAGPGLFNWQGECSISCAPVSSHPTYYPTLWESWAPYNNDGTVELMPPGSLEAVPAGEPLPAVPAETFPTLDASDDTLDGRERRDFFK